MTQTVLVDYVWLTAANDFRWKTRTVKYDTGSDDTGSDDTVPTSLREYLYSLKWSYDGTSTGDISASASETSEVSLTPFAVYRDPFRRHTNCQSFVVLCTGSINGELIPGMSKTREWAKTIMKQNCQHDVWFGLEQEYYLTCLDGDKRLVPLGANNIANIFEQGRYYCRPSRQPGIEIAETHLDYCMYAGVCISGINAEVGPAQWEFQIGPGGGISVSDDLTIARYFLTRLAEERGIIADFGPKPFPSPINGSGCHANYSTSTTRAEGGHSEIINHMTRLSSSHAACMKLYGDGNYARMTGSCETANYSMFSWGIGTRDTSVRIGEETSLAKKGYYEDRRPAANCNPYLVTACIVDSTLGSGLNDCPFTAD